MEISVIIPTFRPQGYLWECLDSLFSQTLPKDQYEVILILNGEKEPYHEMIREYLDRSGTEVSVKLLFTDTGGVSNARNIGLDNAEGRFVIFIDDDDKVSPVYLEELYKKADEQTVVISNTYNFNEDSPSELISVRTTELHSQLSPKGRTSLKASRRFFFTVWMKMIPMDVIAGRRFDTSFSIGEDSIFMFKISDRIAYTDFTSSDAIYYRRIRGNSAMGLQKGKGRGKRIWNDIRMIAAYTWIYLTGLRRYSLHFFLTRVRGAIHI
jgi:glycosyltransferase involved in cell wall biosynthesis